MLDVTDTTFEAEVVEASRTNPVVVDLWAPWCGPCRVQGPIVGQVAAQVGEKAVVAKLDVDKAPKTAQKFGIQSIPTLIVFKDGSPAKQFVGVTEADVLGWVHAEVDQAETEAALAADIAGQKTPVTSDGVPW